MLRLRLALTALLLAAPATVPPPTGGLRGTVRVLEPALFGGSRETGDRSDVVVYLTGFTRPAPAKPALLDQRGERFRPRVLPIVLGQAVTFPNRDRIYHNVFSVSPLHRFDLGQYRATDPPKTEVFLRAGLVPVYCNIHPHMISYVVVLENDAFEVTGRDGGFAIAGAPVGRWQLHAWRPGSKRASREVEVRAGEETVVELELRESERVAPHRRKDGSAYPRPGYEEER